MRLALDGTSLCGSLTGIGRYTAGLLGALAEARPNWEFIVLSPYAAQQVPEAPNIRFDQKLSYSRATHRRGWRNWWFDAVLPRAVRRIDADVFWAASGQAPFCLAQTPVALTLYDFVPVLYPETMSFLPRAYRRVNTRNWIARSTWRLPISRAIGDQLHELYGVEPDGVVYPGVDACFTSAWNEQVPNEKYFVCLGTIEPRKNLLALMACIRTLVDEGTWPMDTRVFLIGGKGWRDGETLSAVGGLERRGVVKRLGYVSQADLPQLLSGARALLMPSLYEGFGMPVAEALACGTPVVCTDLPVFREIVSDRDALFHKPELSSMLETYRRLVTGCSTLPTRTARDVVNGFSWERSAESFISAVGSKGARRR